MEVVEVPAGGAGILGELSALPVTFFNFDLGLADDQTIRTDPRQDAGGEQRAAGTLNP